MRNSKSSQGDKPPKLSSESRIAPASPVVAAEPQSGGMPEIRTQIRMLYRAEIGVRWRDLDAFNHVNNSNYLTYLEEARLQWLATLPGPWMSDDVAPVLAASHINYRRPIGWPERVIVELFVERLGNTSLTLAHRIVSARDASLVYSDGSVVLVWIDRRLGHSAALPDTVRAACVATD